MAAGQWEVALPNPYDLSQPWVDAGVSFPTKKEAVEYVRSTWGGDAKGAITVLSHAPDVGWEVQFPHPYRPGEWVAFDVWPSKAKAVEFLKKTVAADPSGRVTVLFPPPSGN